MSPAITRRSMTVALPLLLMAAVTATSPPQIGEPDVWQSLESNARKPVASGGGRAGLKACPSLCHYTYIPVCGSDGKTYPNLCILQVVGCRNPAVTLRHPGKCVFQTDQGESRCPRACPHNYAPMCGSDGKTYANPCTFRASACRNPTLRVVAEGPCEKVAFPSLRPACPSSCRGDYRPVCGSDGNTYGNQCTLDQESCRNPSVTLAGRGECGTPSGMCPGVCAEVREPVCGSDGVTYQNECVFKAATCMNPSIAFMSTPGECAASQEPQDPCPVLCPALYKPVCGSDGRTYANQCVMNSASCSDPSLATASQGECQLTQPPNRRIATIPTATKTNAASNFSPLRQSCPKYCSRIFSPVCGSDGKTYYNRCLLGETACRERRELAAAYLGRCG